MTLKNKIGSTKKTIEEMLSIMENSEEINGTQILDVSSLLADYDGPKEQFDKYYQRLIRVRTK